MLSVTDAESDQEIVLFPAKRSGGQSSRSKESKLVMHVHCGGPRQLGLVVYIREGNARRSDSIA